MSDERPALIEFVDISVTYGGPTGPVPALRDVSLELHDAELLVVLGANGSGKSTLARLANGLLHPDAGTVRVDGIDTREESRAFDVRSSVGMVFQNPDNQIVATSVEEEVAFGPENLGLASAEIRERITTALAAVGLAGFERREPHTLSGGQKQRLAIAGAVAMRPRHLVLDEPTSMIDPAGREEVAAVLRRMHAEGIAVMLVTQRVHDIALADRVVLLDAGRVAFCGPSAELLADADLLARASLEPPPMARFASVLRQHGVAVPAAELDPTEVVGALWPS